MYCPSLGALALETGANILQHTFDRAVGRTCLKTPMVTLLYFVVAIQDTTRHVPPGIGSLRPDHQREIYTNVSR